MPLFACRRWQGQPQAIEHQTCLGAADAFGRLSDAAGRRAPGRHAARLTLAAVSHAAIGVQACAGARRLAIIPIWPSGRRKNPRRDGRAEGQGRGRRHDPVARRDRQQTRHGQLGRATTVPAMAGALAGVFSAYHPNKHSRATGAGKSTPSLSQLSSATKSRAAAPSWRSLSNFKNLPVTNIGSRAWNRA